MAKTIEGAVRIVFDPTTLHQSRMGSITAIVFFDLGPDKQFPGIGWNDFVVVVASWWLAAVEQVARGALRAELRFMDGPYWITILRAEGSAVRLQCYEERTTPQVVNETVVNIEDLSRELREFSSAVSLACARVHFESPDLDV